MSARVDRTSVPRSAGFAARVLAGTGLLSGAWLHSRGLVALREARTAATMAMRLAVPAVDLAACTDFLAGFAVDGTHVSPIVM